MTDWKELYQQKLIPVEDIAKVIQPHSHCSLSDGAADPFQPEIETEDDRRGDVHRVPAVKT